MRPDQVWTTVLANLRRVGRRPILTSLIAGVLAFCGALTFGVLAGPPTPTIHDEFAYLLAGDTFARGRLTNPPHPHWEFFETFHVLQQPTYSAKYPPGQGLSLALGQTMAEAPIVGVWLGAALATGAVAWALLGALPPQWALVSSLFFLTQLGWVGYWAQSYWGGALAAAGGALALGALLRLRPPVQPRHGVMLGLGYGLLAMTRPLEGFLLAAIFSCVLLYRVMRAGRAARFQLLARGILPCAVVTAGALGVIGLHNRAVTGSVLSMPYRIYEAEYSPTPLLLTQQAEPLPEYRHEQFERFYREWSLGRHESMRVPSNFVRVTLEKVVSLTLFLVGPGLLAFFALGGVSGRGAERVALAGVVGVVTLSLLTKGTYPHYVAPITACLYVLVGRGLEKLHRRARARRTLDWSMVAVLMLLPSLGIRQLPRPEPVSGFPRTKLEIEENLARSPGGDLVFVDYRTGYSVHQEWVYNLADLDDQEVIWARSMGASMDRVLREYYHDRAAWLVTVADSSHLRAYPEVGPR